METKQAKNTQPSSIALIALGGAAASLIWLVVGLSSAPVRASGNVDPPLGRVAACPVAALSGAFEQTPALPRYCVCVGSTSLAVVDIADE